MPGKRRRGRPKQRCLDNIDTKIGPDKVNLVSYGKDSSAFIYKYARNMLKLIVMLDEILLHGKRVWKACLFITSIDTPRHKQVDKKYRQHIVVHKRHTCGSLCLINGVTRHARDRRHVKNLYRLVAKGWHQTRHNLKNMNPKNSKKITDS